MGAGTILVFSVVYCSIGIGERVMILHDSDQTLQFGKDFAKRVQNGGIICLYGDLGAGKTTFTQGLAQGLGIKSRIISPTFIIMRTYQYSKGMLYHIDLYRINSKQELIDLGLPEILENPQNIVVIEWAEKLGDLLPKKRWEIALEYVNNNERKMIVKEVT